MGVCQTSRGVTHESYIPAMECKVITDMPF